MEDVIAIIQRDLSEASGSDVNVLINALNHSFPLTPSSFTGHCLDQLDINCDTYLVNPDYLCTENEIISEILYSDLLKSNCLVTGQPDWGSVKIEYTGNKMDHESLLKYIVSFRDHQEFHEQCIERIFMDIMLQCKPQTLSVHACYTRRGGLDINPFRTTEKGRFKPSLRLRRQ